MGRRHTGRKLAMQILFQCDVCGDSASDVAERYFSQGRFHEETQIWAMELSTGAWQVHEDNDELIKQYAIDWDFDRINGVDKAILRLAFYELTTTKTPHTIVLDEAIELAKKYSTDDSPKFINGILGKYVDDHVHGSD